MTESHAIVIGASIAGLFAARVLSESYDGVTIIDGDAMPTDGAARSGTPQGQHVHAVLAQGQKAIRELFPGLIEDLVEEGVPLGDILTEARPYIGIYRMAQTPSGMHSLCVSRPYLEFCIRNRLADSPKVNFITGRTVTGLVVSPAGDTITGVRIEADTDNSGKVVSGDLIVDASGRNSRTPQWLTKLGYSPPQEQRIRIDVAYSSCTFEMPADTIGHDVGIAVTPVPENPRGGGLIDMGSNKWLISLYGYRGFHPPVSPDGFLEFARSLPVPDIYNALLQATLTGKPIRYSVPHATRRHYDRLTRFPNGFVVLGDAACSFNPVYGQGMSVAAKEALLLRRCDPRRGKVNLARLRRDIARASSTAWRMSVSSDLRMPWINGVRSLAVRLGNAYLAQLFPVAQQDPTVAVAFMRVANLIDHQLAILRPSIVWRVVVGNLRLRGRVQPPRTTTTFAADHQPS